MTIVVNLIIIGLIIVLSVVVFWRLIISSSSLAKISDRFEVINVTKSTYDERVNLAGEIIKKEYSENIIDQAELEKNRDNYYLEYSNYVVCSQIIAIFPLLGILGTVWGLVMGGIDADMLLEGLSTALYTTLAGLVASIILKFIDAVFVGKKINLIDAKFEKADAIINRQIIRSEIRSASNNMR